MTDRQYVLALDQGTTSSRAILFTHDGRAVAMAQREFRQILPAPGVVQHDVEEIWEGQLAVAREVIERAGATAEQIAAIGVTNQRETTVLWERGTGKPIDHAIVWQSRITEPVCQQLRSDGHEPTFRRKTGLVLDAYFSGTKIKFLLDKHPGLRERAERGEVLFGTIDSYLIYRLTGGRRHVTDLSNASRTLLLDIHRCDWDQELLQILDVPRAMLPELVPSSGVVGETDSQWFGRSLPIGGIAGDQQAATFGQACFEPGQVKNTYGTGCFMLLNTGNQPIVSEHQLLTTIGWSLDGQVTYCLEGSVFVAGAVVQWLRDGLGLIERSEQIEALAASVPDNGGVYFVPAFVGLGAPYWDPHARGTLVGISRGTTAGHLARAAVESMALQSCDLLEAMQADASGVTMASMRVDGGAAVNDALMQYQADMLGAEVLRPVVAETTALGAAYLAGLATGFWQSLNDIRSNWQLDRRFEPQMDQAQRRHHRERWKRAVECSRHWDAPQQECPE